MLPLLFALACSGDDPKNPDAGPEDTGSETGVGDDTGPLDSGDSGDSGLPEEDEPLFTDRGCRSDDPVDGLEPAEALGDLSWRVVSAPTALFEELYLLLIYPTDEGSRAWEDGAPVVVVAPPVFEVDQTTADAPTPVFDASYGVIEVQPIYPGFSVGGYTTSGGLDEGGLMSSSAFAEAVRFATGELTLYRGESIGELLGRPICNGRVGTLGVGTGAIALMAGIAPSAEIAERIAGFALWESPTLPQLLTRDVGAVWMDPDPAVDGDGNGVAWDDGRNVDWSEGSCDTISCPLDYEDIAWDPDTRPSEVFPGRYEDAPPGVMYLDRQGSGALEIAAGGGLDADGDGMVGADEDFVFLPYYGLDGTRYYNSQLVRVADDKLEAWPEDVADFDASNVFFATRSVMEEGKVVASLHAPDYAVVVAYTAEDHELALADRPQVALVHDLFAEAGFPTRYNPSAAALDCLTDEANRDGYTGGPPRGALLEERELQGYAMPESLDAASPALAGLMVLWDAFGAFDLCPR